MSLRKTLTAWGRLLRLPNLLTVPGDPLVGFVSFIGFGFSWANPALWAAMGASLLLYAAGLIHNDLCDLAEDRRERPNRPLANGSISPISAAVIAISLTVSACTLAWVFCGPIASAVTVLLSLTILAYNAICKHNALLGPLTMGLCRGLSVLLGASAAINHVAIMKIMLLFAGFLVAVWTLYIAAVTFLARRETMAQRLTLSRVLPCLAPLFVICWLAYGILNTEESHSRIIPLNLWTLCTTWLLATINAASPIWKLRGIAQPADIQRMIGRLIRNLLLMQAALLFGVGLWQVGIVFLILHPIHARLARWFYAS
jgi:hypothetical protein